MKIRWEIGDGYVGKSRPQYTTIPDSEFEHADTKEEIHEIIQTWVDHDFHENITYDWDIDDPGTVKIPEESK